MYYPMIQEGLMYWLAAFALTLINSFLKGALEVLELFTWQMGFCYLIVLTDHQATSRLCL